MLREEGFGDGRLRHTEACRAIHIHHLQALAQQVRSDALMLCQRSHRYTPTPRTHRHASHEFQFGEFARLCGVLVSGGGSGSSLERHEAPHTGTRRKQAST